MLRKLFFCFSLSFVFLFAGCATLRDQVLSAEEEALLYPVSSYVPETFEWQKVAAGEDGCVVPGVWTFDFENPDIPLIYHAVKIDLSGASGSGAAAGQGTRGGAGSEAGTGLTLASSQWERTADFAERQGCLVAMNATPFDKTKLAGIYKLDGQLLSGPVARYAALGLRCGAGGEVQGARIFASQTDGELAEYNAAFGGFFVVLEKGEVRTEYVRRYTARSGAGLSADGKALYLLVVEGERPRQSRGLSYPQCGEIFRAMGCSDALEFDGGESSDLCINGCSVMSYKVRRVQGNSIGLKKRP